jgi:hypothetical protein
MHLARSCQVHVKEVTIMPQLFGLTVSPDVAQLNSHLTTVTTKQPARKAVTLWRNEDQFQAAVFQAAAWEALQRPEFDMMFHIANENAHKRPGVKGGIPDLFLPMARGCYHGLFVELKIGGNKPSQKQLDVISELRSQGYQVNVIWDSVDEVIETIANYLKQKAA